MATLSIPFFRGPLQTTASSFEFKRNPMDMTEREGRALGDTGIHPEVL
jgi:hypothetical protein